MDIESMMRADDAGGDQPGSGSATAFSSRRARDAELAKTVINASASGT